MTHLKFRVGVHVLAIPCSASKAAAEASSSELGRSGKTSCGSMLMAEAVGGKSKISSLGVAAYSVSVMQYCCSVCMAVFLTVSLYSIDHEERWVFCQDF